MPRATLHHTLLLATRVLARQEPYQKQKQSRSKGLQEAELTSELAPLQPTTPMEFLSQMWSLLGLLTILQNVLPTQLLSLLHSLWQSLQDSLTPYSYFDVPEFLGSAAVEPNALYRHVHLYLHRSLLLSSPPPPRLTLSLPRSPSGAPSPAAAPAPPSVSLSPNHSVADTFDGHRAVWTHHADTLQDSLEERRSFSLRLPKRHAAAVLPAYLAHLAAAADHLERSSRARRLHTNAAASTHGAAAWASVPFCHPATFDTLALDPALRARLLADLTAFAEGREFYRRTGRPWKRGYLLHGPPGSGKSSLIAAMANHLRYDVFDLELTRVATNADLRALLLQTTNRSIIVIEDIDCSLHLTGDRSERLHKRRKLHAAAAYDDDSSDSDDDDAGGNGADGHRGKVTLSGLLNFTDGLWSCCGEERIIVFTTNHVDGVDPALLRPGRMDVHVRLGACGAHAMRQLVRSYVGVGDHEMVDAAEDSIRGGAEMTPAEVGEVLLRNRDEPETAVAELAAKLKARRNAADDLGWDDSAAELSDGSPTKKGRKGLGWEGKVRILGRLRSLTKSDSGRR